MIINYFIKCNIKRKIDRAIEFQDQKELRTCVAAIFKQVDPIDKVIYPTIARVLIETWHHAHEDILGLIWLKSLRDNIFVDPIMLIAQQGDIYRLYDGELESALRKCVHALKEIGTEKSILALKKLIDSGNKNVLYALENYRGEDIE